MPPVTLSPYFNSAYYSSGVFLFFICFPNLNTGPRRAEDFVLFTLVSPGPPKVPGSCWVRKALAHHILLITFDTEGILKSTVREYSVNLSAIWRLLSWDESPYIFLKCWRWWRFCLLAHQGSAWPTRICMLYYKEGKRLWDFFLMLNVAFRLLPSCHLKMRKWRLTKVSLPAWEDPPQAGALLTSIGCAVFSGKCFIKSKGLEKQSFKESRHYINEDILRLKIENIIAKTHIRHD